MFWRQIVHEGDASNGLGRKGKNIWGGAVEADINQS